MALLIAGVGIVIVRSESDTADVPSLAGAEKSSCTDSTGDQTAEQDPGDSWADLREARLEYDGERLLAVFIGNGDVPTTSSSHTATWTIQLHDGSSATGIAISATRFFGPGADAPWRLQLVDAALRDAMGTTFDPDALVTLDPDAVRVDHNVVSFEVPTSRLRATPGSVEWVAAAIQTGEQRDITDLISNRAYDFCPDSGPPSVDRVVRLGTNQWDEGGPSESLVLGATQSSATPTSSASTSPSTEDSEPTRPESTADVATCPTHPTERIGATQAARCTYFAYVEGNRELALVYADPAAVDALFEHAWEPPEWEFGGCELEGVESASTGAACYYSIPGEPHGVRVEMLLGGGPSAGNFVEAVEFYG